MILLLGGKGYVGQAFAANLQKQGLDFVAPSHAELDAASKEALATAVRDLRPKFVINAIGFTGRPNIDGTEQEKLHCLATNTYVPGVIAEVLADQHIPWGHVSSGCIFDGARPDGSPFTEEDKPNHAHPAASFYARTKAMAETVLLDHPGCIIWRLRIPFDEFDNDRNYLTKIMRYERLLEVSNSISHLQEFAQAGIETLVRRLPGGVYNVTNPGIVTTSEVAEAIQRHGLHDKPFHYFSGEQDFLATPGRVKRASCLLSSQKLADAGIQLREVHEAIEWSLNNWQCRT